MKQNAIIRIIIWSIVIVLLVGIMGSVIVANSYKTYHRVSESELELTATIPYEMPQNALAGTVTENVNVRTAPDTDAGTLGMLLAGDTVDVTRIEMVNGIHWAYITPQQGWVQAEYLEILNENAVAAETDPNPAVSPSPSPISELEIEWVTGNILIQAADVEDIQVSESEVSDPKYAMQLKRTSKKLSIEFCEDDILERGFGISIGEELNKDLTILVPMRWTLDSLEVDAASAELEVYNLMIRDVEFDGASGTCCFENCMVEKLDLDTASGDVTFSGTLQVLDCDAASASVRATLGNVPDRIDMDSMSGDLELTLPENAGFTLSMDAMSSDFFTDFGYSQQRGGTYTAGDGNCQINMDGMSGDVYIYQAVAAAAVPEAPITEETTVQETVATETTAPIISNHHVHSDACREDPNSCPDLNETHHPET